MPPEKSKKKKSAHPAENPDKFKRVFVWELDELCDTRLIPPQWQAKFSQLVDQMVMHCFQLNTYDVS